MIVQKNINKDFFDREVARFEIAEDVIDRIENLMAAAPDIFNTDKNNAFGKMYTGEIKIAIKAITDSAETVTKLYAIEDDGVVFTAERKKDNEVSSVFIATGSWPEKFERLEDSVREAR